MAGDQNPKTLSSRTPGGRTTPVLVPQAALAGQPDVPLDRPITTAGSNDSARLRLVSRTVSKSHAIFVNSNGSTYVADMASRTGVLLNGKLVKDSELKTGDRVQIGKFVFRFRSPANVAPAAHQPQSPPASIIVVGSPAVPIDGRAVIVGRRETNDIAIPNDAGVSAAHAVVFQMDGKWYMRDLGSRTGTHVNGKPIHQQQLRFGDRIVVGSTTILFQPGSTTADHLDDSSIANFTPDFSSDLQDDADALTETAAGKAIPDEIPLADATAAEHLMDWKSAFPATSSDAMQEPEATELPGHQASSANEPEAVPDELSRSDDFATPPSQAPGESAASAAIIDDDVPLPLEEYASNALPTEPDETPSEVDQMSSSVEPIGPATAAHPLEPEELPLLEETAEDFAPAVNEEPASAAEAGSTTAHAPLEPEHAKIDASAADESSEPIAIAENAPDSTGPEKIPADDASAATAPEPSAVESDPVLVAETPDEPPRALQLETAAAAMFAAPVPPAAGEHLLADVEDFVFVPTDESADPNAVPDVLFWGDPELDSITELTVSEPVPETVTPILNEAQPTGGADPATEMPSPSEPSVESVDRVPAHDQAHGFELRADAAPAAEPISEVPPQAVQSEPSEYRSTELSPVDADATDADSIDVSTETGPAESPVDPIEQAAADMPIADEAHAPESIADAQIGATINVDATGPAEHESIADNFEAAKADPAGAPADPSTATLVEPAAEVTTSDHVSAESPRFPAPTVEGSDVTAEDAEATVADDFPDIAVETETEVVWDQFNLEASDATDQGHLEPTPSPNVSDENAVDDTPLAESANALLTAATISVPAVDPEEPVVPPHAQDTIATDIPATADADLPADSAPADAADIDLDAFAELESQQTEATDPQDNALDAELADPPAVRASTTPDPDVSDFDFEDLVELDESPDSPSNLAKVEPYPTVLAESIELESSNTDAPSTPPDSPAVVASTTPDPDLSDFDVEDLIELDESPDSPSNLAKVEPDPTDLSESLELESSNTDAPSTPPDSPAVVASTTPEPDLSDFDLDDLAELDATADPANPPAAIASATPYLFDFDLEDVTEPESNPIAAQSESLAATTKPIDFDSIDAGDSSTPAEPPPAPPAVVASATPNEPDFDFDEFLHPAAAGESPPVDSEVTEPAEPVVSESPRTADFAGIVNVNPDALLEESKTLSPEPAASTESLAAQPPVATNESDLDFLDFGEPESPVAESPVDESPVAESPVDESPVAESPASAVQAAADDYSAPNAEPVNEAPPADPTPPAAPATATPPGPRRGPSLFGFDFEGGSFLGGMPISLADKSPAPPSAPMSTPPVSSPTFDARTNVPTGLGAMLAAPTSAPAIPPVSSPAAPDPATVSTAAGSVISAPRLSGRPTVPPAVNRSPVQSLSGLVSEARPASGPPVIPPVEKNGSADQISAQRRGLTGAQKGPGLGPRNVEVFSQLSAPIGVEVFGGRPGNPDQFIVPDIKETTEPPPGDDPSDEKQLAVDETASAESAAAPTGQNVRRLRIPLLVSLMVLIPVFAWIFVHFVVQESTTLSGRLTFAGTASQQPVDLHEFHKAQESLLYSEDVRTRAQKILQQHHQPEGMTQDSEPYRQNMPSENVNWIDNALEFTLSSSSETQCKAQITAVLQALAQKDHDLELVRQQARQDADTAKARVDALNAQLAKMRSDHQALAEKAADAPDAVTVSETSEEVIRLTQQWKDALTMRTNSESVLTELKSEDPRKPIDPETDTEIKQLKSQLQPVIEQIQIAKSRGGVNSGSSAGIGTDVSVGAATQPDFAPDPLLAALQQRADALNVKIQRRREELAAAGAIPPEQRAVNQQSAIENLSVEITDLQKKENDLKSQLDLANTKSRHNQDRMDAARVAAAQKEDLYRQIADTEAQLQGASNVWSAKEADYANCITVADEPKVKWVAVTDLRNKILMGVSVLSWFVLGLMIVGEVRRPKLMTSVRPASIPTGAPMRVVPWPQPHQLQGLESKPGGEPQLATEAQQAMGV